jgi:hypothetical protein
MKKSLLFKYKTNTVAMFSSFQNPEQSNQQKQRDAIEFGGKELRASQLYQTS